MEPELIIEALRRRFILIVAHVVVGIAAGVALAVFGTPVFSSSATAIVVAESDGSSNNVSGSQLIVASIMPTIVQLGSSHSLQAQVAQDTGLPLSQVEGRISVANPTTTFMVEITAEGATAAQAQQLADAEVKAMRKQITGMSVSLSGKPAQLSLSDVDAANLPTAPIGPSKLRYGIVGAVLGSTLGVLIALALDSRLGGRRSSTR
ncbi:Capsular polysaccharide biosynthesis protein [Actinomyces bovis]|uniref:Capsular polysaccharide biosynthesis protein n=1 Tax=Actinomyces bovis TaxID=1658 RepID=A0ABY1VN09_9ACTO|nr:Wzz/FepE/Etk N-terminal domain-containing protein [Actinomyces bovis]SPT53137.1 Capsular polysaccharide biosynthesis protein [Actinomyces bovis]VEG52297.1 Capsular polysaccharide biosynthesis protein [Actinomyces israelii]